MIESVSRETTYENNDREHGKLLKGPIPIIKAIREITKLGLAESKFMFDRVAAGNPQMLTNGADRVPQVKWFTDSDEVQKATKLLVDAGAAVTTIAL